jgi:uncharacterized membrane protein YphA (DoxX/SURF4 family)
MEKLNNLLEKIANPLVGFADWIIRLGLGISFFLHGLGKLPVSEGAIKWMASKGVPLADVTTYLVAWGETLAGLGIIAGGILMYFAQTLGNIITRLSGGAIAIIMMGVFFYGHPDWDIFKGERGSIVFASEQLFLLLLGIYFAIKGNQKQ